MVEEKSINIIKENKNGIALAALSEIGDRSEQQDAFGFCFENEQSLIVVCDGMGGHAGGRIASSIATEGFISDCSSGFVTDDCQYQDLLISCAKRVDREIASLTDENGVLLNAGSTAVAVIIAYKQLFWCSCGDSRAYLLRSKEFVQFTQDQNYKTVLREELNAGIITKDDYLKRVVDGDALVSFLGIGDLSLIDHNESPLLLYSGDRIVITTDGLYKIIPDADIKRILSNAFSAEEAVNELWLSVLQESRDMSIPMDNTTIIVVDIQ